MLWIRNDLFRIQIRIQLRLFQRSGSRQKFPIRIRTELFKTFQKMIKKLINCYHLKVHISVLFYIFKHFSNLFVPGSRSETIYSGSESGSSKSFESNRIRIYNTDFLRVYLLGLTRTANIWRLFSKSVPFRTDKDCKHLKAIF